MGDVDIQKYIKALKQAQSDNDKFAALLLITKFMNVEKNDLSEKREILDALGYSFLTRLLKTTVVPDGCPPCIYKSVALSILSSCCSDPHVVSHPELKKQVPIFCEIIVQGNDKSTDELEQSVVSDCYDCIKQMASTRTGQLTLIEGGIVPALVTVITNSSERGKAFEILMNLLQSRGKDIWRGNIGCYVEIMKWLVTCLKDSEDIDKFELCDILICFLSANISDELEKAPWIGPLVSILDSLIRCKLGATHRESVLKLASHVVITFGVKSVLPPFTQDSKLILILIHLTCIEVRMVLEDGNMQKIQEKMEVLCTYYSLLEAVIGYMTVGESLPLDSTQVVQLHSAMTGAFNSIIYFLSQTAEAHTYKESYHPVVIASVRMLGAWLAEETESLKKEILSLLPFLVHICKMSVDISVSMETLTLKKTEDCDMECCECSQDDVNSQTEDDGVDVIRFLLPGFCHLTSEDEARKILIQEGAPTFLVDYFKKKMEIFLKNKEKSEIQDTVCTLCGILLNLAVTEPDLAASHHQFHSLLDSLFLYLPQIALDSSLLLVTANFASLGLIIIRNQNKRQDIKVEDRNRFLASSVSFLKNAHRSSKVSSQCCLVLSDSYSELWSSIKHLWFISVDVLTALMSVMPDVIQIIIKSGWLPSLLRTLIDVRDADVDNDVKVTYLLLLLAAAKNSCAAKKIIVEKGGLEVAKIYKDQQLFNVLSTSV